MTAPLLTRTEVVVLPDPARVIAQLFLPGQEMLTLAPSRAAGVMERCLEMSEDEVRSMLADTLARFSTRHRDLVRIWENHFDAVAHRVADGTDLSPDRRRLIGAYFTAEYALEAAALFNPCMVRHPDQAGLGPDQTRFVMSARAVGEGHVSSIVFRTGVIGPARQVTLDPACPYATIGNHRSAVLDRELLRGQASETSPDLESLDFVLDLLPERFTLDALKAALGHLREQELTRGDATPTATHVLAAATSTYEVDFPAEVDLSERVIWPAVPEESHGIEDARFVLFTEDGTVSYRATYTAFDGVNVVPRLLQTTDFRTFTATRFTGGGARDKGMALFPRRVGGRYLALSRWDRENNAIATSEDGHAWATATTLQTPRYPWEVIQLGNCGSPIETPVGWLVLTHGVGTMRAYSIGATLLDLHDPTRVIASLPEPLLTPERDERDGYVPNVVYSCGALSHGEYLFLPYGCSDSRIRIAVIHLATLLDRLLAQGGAPRSV